MYFVAVHAGAGYHGVERQAAYTAAMRRALKAAARALDEGAGSMEAVKAAICVLEDDPVTNAGYGSNLTLEGTVECDASIMSGDGTSGAVGAVPGVHNPIAAAYQLAVLSRSPLPCGLVRPEFLAGDGARRWAVNQGITAAETTEEAQKALISPAAADAWRHYLAILQQAQAAQQTAQHAAHTGQQDRHQQQVSTATTEQQQSEQPQQPQAKKARIAQTLHSPSQQQQLPQQPQVQQHQKHHLFGGVCDTVGCIVISSTGAVAAGVSSGGLALKTAGRVGEAAVVGAGAWADDERGGGGGGGGGDVTLPGVCVSVSGVGERIMSASLAKVTAMQLQVNQQQQQLDQLVTGVLESNILNQPGPWDAGVIAARVTCSSSSDDDSNSGSKSSSRSEASSREQDEHDHPGKALSSQVPRQTPDVQQAPQQQQQQPEQQEELALCGSVTDPQEVTDPPKHRHQQQVRVEFVAAFTSESFAVGYIAPSSNSATTAEPKVHILRREAPGSAATTASQGQQLHRAPERDSALDDACYAHNSVDEQQRQVKCMMLSCKWTKP